jgi:hypothetical protein
MLRAVRFAMPTSHEVRGVLLPHHFTLTSRPERQMRFLSVALSVGYVFNHDRLAVSQHRLSITSGLSSVRCNPQRNRPTRWCVCYIPL